ncbi:MAG: PF20097 family protein [Anaerovoracaceae bacterium]
MRCPYCKNEMKTGFLMGLSRLAWGPTERKRALYEIEGELTLSTGYAVASIPASRCEICNKIIISELYLKGDK